MHPPPGLRKALGACLEENRGTMARIPQPLATHYTFFSMHTLHLNEKTLGVFLGDLEPGKSKGRPSCNMKPTANDPHIDTNVKNITYYIFVLNVVCKKHVYKSMYPHVYPHICTCVIYVWVSPDSARLKRAFWRRKNSPVWLQLKRRSYGCCACISIQYLIFNIKIILNNIKYYINI